MKKTAVIIMVIVMSLSLNRALNAYGFIIHDYMPEESSTIETIIDEKEQDSVHGLTPSYSQSIPSNAENVHINAIGGESVIWNQLIRNGSFLDTGEWTVYSEDRSEITARDSELIYSVKSVGNQYFSQRRLNYAAGHRYFLAFDFYCDKPVEVYACQRAGYLGTRFTPKITTVAGWNSIREIVTITDTDYKSFSITVPSAFLEGGDSFKVKNVILVDLTKMFGNHVNLAERIGFIEAYSASHPEYNTGELISADVEKIVITDSERNESCSLIIPQELREDYPLRSAGRVHDEYDFERKVFIRRIGSRDHRHGDESDEVVITDGTATLYPLSSALEIDISSYLPAGLWNVIEVEGGETLTFVQKDLSIPVSNTTSFSIKKSQPADSCEQAEAEEGSNMADYQRDVLECLSSYIVHQFNGTQVIGEPPADITENQFHSAYSTSKGYENVFSAKNSFIYSDINAEDNKYVFYGDCETFVSLLTECIPYEESSYYYAFSEQSAGRTPDSAEIFIRSLEYGAAEPGSMAKPYTFDLFNMYSGPVAQTAKAAEEAAGLYKICENDIKLATMHWDEAAFSALETGDLLFFGYDEEHKRYKDIGHIAMYIKDFKELDDIAFERYGVHIKPIDYGTMWYDDSHGFLAEIGSALDRNLLLVSDGLDVIRVRTLAGSIAYHTAGINSIMISPYRSYTNVYASPVRSTVLTSAKAAE